MIWKPNDQFPPSAVERFARYVPVDAEEACWEWHAGRDNENYGRFHVTMQRRGILAHRAAWELTNGPIPAGMCVLHRCDNPPCVNPGHMFLGTQRDNNADRDAKGRTNAARPGELHHMAKLTWADVREIRRAYPAGDASARELGLRYGVSRTHIHKIVAGGAWREEQAA